MSLRLTHRKASLRAARVPAFCLAPLAALLSQPAWAQPAAEPGAPTLREVRINATAEKDVGFAPQQAETAGKAPMRRLETPQSISVVTREQMESRQVTNLQQALQTVPGVSPVNFGRRGFDDITIRGFRSTESILIDGLVQSPGMWTRLQQYGYERFEVLKGANSVLYGQIQPGGVVNAISKRPRREALSEAGLEVGSFDHKSVFTDINRPLSPDGKAAFRVNALVSDSGDPTDFVFRKDQWLAPSLALDFGPGTDFVVFATYARSKWLRQQGITPHGTLLPNPNGKIPLTRFAGEPAFGPYDISQYTIGYALEHQFRPDLVLRQNVRYEEEKGVGRGVFNAALQSNRRLQNRTASFQEMDYDLLATDTSMLWRFDALGAQHRLVAGLDARTGTSLLGNRSCSIGALDLYNPVYGVPVTCPATRSSDAPAKLTAAGFYVQDQIKFGQGWTALLGVRHERSRNDTDDRIRSRRTIRDDHATTGSAGLVYEFARGWAAYASYSESFLPVSGQTFDGGQFQPETGQQWETGVKYEAAGLNGALSVYDLRRQNVTTADPVHSGFSVQNGEQRARGVELELGADLAKGVKLTGAYTYIDTEVTRDTNASIIGKPANFTPRHTVALWGTWRVPQWQRLTVGMGVRYVSEQKRALPFTLPAYTVADASVSYAADRWRWTAGVKNVFDKAYYDGAVNVNVVSPAAPRSFMLTGTYFF